MGFLSLAVVQYSLTKLTFFCSIHLWPLSQAGHAPPVFVGRVLSCSVCGPVASRRMLRRGPVEPWGPVGWRRLEGRVPFQRVFSASPAKQWLPLTVLHGAFLTHPPPADAH